MEKTEKQILIDKLTSKELRLSYSTLKQFTSPINLIRYKLKPFRKNPSMIFGSLCDVLLLTPDKFNSEFVITDKIPTTDNQINFCLDVVELLKINDNLENDDIKNSFDKFYKRGDFLKTYEPLKDYIDAISTGKEVLTQSIYDEAKELTENLLNQKDISELFMQITEVQKKVEWTDNGWSFIGYLDILIGDNHIIDLKFSKDSNPDKFERDIANFDYFLQAGMYCLALIKMGITNLPKFSFIVFDKSFNYSIIHLDYGYMMYGQRKYKHLLNELDRMIEEKQFNKSYNFFNKEKVVYKPKWAKGYDTE